MEPYIFDIVRGSTVDGPGLRTTVFFKGCNLNCFWCHNPEGKSSAPQMAFFKEKCIGCGACAASCPHELRHCDGCGACCESCPAEARRQYGKRYSDQELRAVLLADEPFYRATGGGVTFSGGECMLYPDTVARLGSLLQNRGIAVAVDTAGNVDFSAFEKVLPVTSLFLYDIKALDSRLHRQGTGVDNGRILQNLEKLIACGAKVQIRVPVIPGFNEGQETERIKDYCARRLLPVTLLPYHEMGEAKQQALLPGSVCR